MEGGNQFEQLKAQRLPPLVQRDELISPRGTTFLRNALHINLVQRLHQSLVDRDSLRLVS